MDVSLEHGSGSLQKQKSCRVREKDCIQILQIQTYSTYADVLSEDFLFN